ncbi:MAG: DUF3501 family protein [Proteobacteria bacterium]|nr:DUF3501 family protein [Pseudomonadota bacterium]
MTLVRPISRRDIKGPAIYGPIRDDYRHRVIALKRSRRLLIGDRVSFVFENRLTLTMQIEEMCRAENLTTEVQIQGEIDVYNELMPTDTSLSATLFVELPPDIDVHIALKELVGLDEHVVLHIGPHTIRAAFEPGRSTDEKISAVQYVRFPLTPAARAELLSPGAALALEIDHPNYPHRVVCSEETRASLAADYA